MKQLVVMKFTACLMLVFGKFKVLASATTYYDAHSGNMKREGGMAGLGGDADAHHVIPASVPKN
ncbi:hypothetical protein RHSIM_Rhsim10G0110400 [Rhododendron simsii]|uniref:Uncharacterized protein n=1 Tax=Rhododendron simsii TaxID=118357 RepID=A0A834LCH4_RHOSS|nr:hypothetical protein RHSIM_Rhsim10G0110400 [Rhododendron simsii]